MARTIGWRSISFLQKKVVRMCFLRGKCLLAILMLLPLTACSADEAEQIPIKDTQIQPNVILIMVDDMGYSDPGFIGGDMETPNIDKLAAEGIVFTQFYNNAKCSQTRASLLSGLYYQQARKPGPRGNLGHDQLAMNNNSSLAEIMKSAGYATSMVGKWHLSGTPYELGFDKFYGFLEGSHSHWDSSNVFGQYSQESDSFYSTDAFTSAAIKFIKESVSEDKPAFVYLAYTAPHYPLHAPEADIERFKGRFSSGWDAIRDERVAHMKSSGQVPENWGVSRRLQGQQSWDQHEGDWNWSELSEQENADQQRLMEVYAAMLYRLDVNIGRLMDTLRALNEEENTIVFFLSDNGGSPYSMKDEPGSPAGPAGTFRTLNTPWAEVNSAPFRLFKRYSHEGGISTPMIAWWPEKIEAGETTDSPFHVIDFMPSLVDLTGSEFPDSRYGDSLLSLPGQSFIPVMKGSKGKADRKLFWEYQENYAMREGKWKLVQSNLDKRWELFDMHLDRGEVNDLSALNTDRVERMKTSWQAWFEAVTSNKEVVN